MGISVDKRSTVHFMEKSYSRRHNMTMNLKYLNQNTKKPKNKKSKISCFCKWEVPEECNVFGIGTVQRYITNNRSKCSNLKVHVFFSCCSVENMFVFLLTITLLQVQNLVSVFVFLQYFNSLHFTLQPNYSIWNCYTTISQFSFFQTIS